MAIIFIFFFLVSAFIGIFRCCYRGYKVENFLFYMTLLEVITYLVMLFFKQKTIIKNDCLESSLDPVFSKAIDRVLEVILNSYVIICAIIIFLYTIYFAAIIIPYCEAKFLTEKPVSF